METLRYSRAALQPTLRVQYLYVSAPKTTIIYVLSSSLEILPPIKRKEYEAFLTDTIDDSLLNELLDNEMLDNNQEVARRLELLKAPRLTTSDSGKHYDLLNDKHLPALHHGYFVRVT
mgnify:CR=1 FL=1